MKSRKRIVTFICVLLITALTAVLLCSCIQMTSSDSFSKIMSCYFNRPVPDLVNHQYGICRMYSEEDPQDFRLSVPCLYP